MPDQVPNLVLCNPPTPSGASRTCSRRRAPKRTRCRRSAGRRRRLTTWLPSELARLNEQGRLETLAGVGKSTAAVISEALSGSVARLPAGPRGAGHRAARPARSGSSCSRCGATATAIRTGPTGAARSTRWRGRPSDLGHEYLVLTDHSPRLTVANGLSADDLRRQIDVVAELNEVAGAVPPPYRHRSRHPRRRRARPGRGAARRLDVVVASVHSKLRMETAEMTARMIAAVENPHVDILGHCTGRRIVGRQRPQSSFDHEAVFAACAATGTAVEINSRPDRRDPPEELLRVAAAAGCRFSIDSDAHAPGQLSWLRLGCEQAVEAGYLRIRLSTPCRWGSSWPGRRATNCGNRALHSGPDAVRPGAASGLKPSDRGRPDRGRQQNALRAAVQVGPDVEPSRSFAALDRTGQHFDLRGQPRQGAAKDLGHLVGGIALHTQDPVELHQV